MIVPAKIPVALIRDLKWDEGEFSLPPEARGVPPPISSVKRREDLTLSRKAAISAQIKTVSKTIKITTKFILAP